jgi:hypothetical protein
MDAGEVSPSSSVARPLFVMVAWPERRNAEKNHVGGEAAKQTNCWYDTVDD